jgi:hypothetical protein
MPLVSVLGGNVYILPFHRLPATKVRRLAVHVSDGLALF